MRDYSAPIPASRMKTSQTNRLALALITVVAVFSICPERVSGHEEKEHQKGAPHASASVPKDYPLKKCVVSDEPLGEHGKPVKVTAPDGTNVYLCCNCLLYTSDAADERSSVDL